MSDQSGGTNPEALRAVGGFKRVRNWAAQRVAVQRRHRAFKLLGAMFATLGLVWVLERIESWSVIHNLGERFAGGPFFHPLFFPSGTIEWKDRVQAVLVLLGLPAAFLLWHWRDSNVRAQIENQRRDISLRESQENAKEFREVQLHAAGGMDEKLPAEAREQLQIAALHQLQGFFRGEYGESFRRPAFELLLTGHAAAMERIGYLKAIDGCVSPSMLVGEQRSAISRAGSGAREKLTAIDRERLSILRQEAAAIFSSGYPLEGRRFDLISLIGTEPAERGRLSRCIFTGARLIAVKLSGAQLNSARLEGADLSAARFDGANLRWAHLNGAEMYLTSLERANLSEADLTGADLSKAKLNGANLTSARFEGAQLFEATFDAATIFAENWDALSEDERDAYRKDFVARGAIRSDLRSQ